MKQLLLILSLICSITVNAQDKIESDRSDEGEGARTIGKYKTQLEAGAYLVDFENGDNAAVAEVSARYGLFKRLDVIAVIQDGWQRDKFINETSQGFYPLALGAKVALLDKHSFLPDISLSAYVKMPFTSHSESEAQHWSKAFNAILEKEIFDKKWNILANVGLQQQTTDESYQWQTVGVLCYQGIDKFNIMGEYFATYQSKGEPQNNIGLGISYHLTDNIQADISASTTIGTYQPNKCISTGIAVRF